VTLEEASSHARHVGMQPFRVPPHVLALVLTATLLLFLAGIIAAKTATHDANPIAPSAPFLPQPR
jgi:hypothetical protein